MPSYLAMLNEAKEKIRQLENNQQQQHSSPSVLEIGQSPPVLKKIPVYPKSNLQPITVTPYPPPPPPPSSKIQSSPSMQSNAGSPLSMLSDMFIPNWFKDQETTNPGVLPSSQSSYPHHQLSRPLQKSSSKLPILPPPRDFPSFEQSKNQGKLLLRRKSAQQPRPQRMPKPKPGGNFMRNDPNNDNFPSRLRPVQFTPIEGASGIPYQVRPRGQY